MKKLLLFILVLFGCMSALSMADNMCGPNGQFDPQNNTCWPTQGGYTPDPPAPKYTGGIAIDPNTGAYGWGAKYTSKSSLKTDVLKSCGSSGCVFLGALAFKQCGGLAYSETDKIYGYDTVIYWTQGDKDRKKRVEEKALKKCEKNGGKSCVVQVSVCDIGKL